MAAASHQQTKALSDLAIPAHHCAYLEIRGTSRRTRRGQDDELVGSGLIFTYWLGVSPRAIAAWLALVALHLHVSV